MTSYVFALIPCFWNMSWKRRSILCPSASPHPCGNHTSGWTQWILDVRLVHEEENMPGSCDSPAGSGVAPGSRASTCTWSERNAGRPNPPTWASDPRPDPWTEPSGCRRSEGTGTERTMMNKKENNLVKKHFWICACVLMPTWARMFCSLMSFCLSRLGVEVTTDRTSWPLFGTTHTKNTRSSRSLVTNLKIHIKDDTMKCNHKNVHAVPRHMSRHASVPPLILSDVAVLKLPHCRLQDLAGVVGKVQVSDLRQGNGHDGESLFVLFSGAGADLSWEPREESKQSIHVCLTCVSVWVWTSVCVCACVCVWTGVCGDLEHNRALLLCVDGDVGARHPGVGAQVPKSHVGVSEDRTGSLACALYFYWGPVHLYSALWLVTIPLH